MRYYVSGHLTTTREEFDEHYRPRLEAIRSTDLDASFVVGDARGTDLMAQEWLLANGFQGRVIVYHMLSRPRNNLGFTTIGGYGTDDARDAAMTAASDRDVAWVRPGRENSGTARNIARRAGLGSQMG